MDNKAGQMKKVSIVIPALNEEQGIEGTIKAIAEG
jgi:glycosyltransferase involved in cell wall biosynthesis